MNSQKKGKWNENKLARQLSEVYPEAKRSYEERSGNSGDLVNTGNYIFELKAGKRPSIYKAYSQACEASQAGETPVGVVKFDRSRRSDPRNGRKAFRGVMLNLEDFIELLKQAE